MAPLHPTARVVARHLARTISQNSTIQTSGRASCRSAHLIRRVTINQSFAGEFHSSRLFLRDDDVFGSSGRRPVGLKTPRTAPTDPTSNDAYPDGAPGEPKEGESLPSGIAPSTLYTFEDMQSISSAPESYPKHIIIDVREPGELLQTGRIPGALNIPISSAPDSFFMGAEDFEDKYGFARPGDADEVIFYCKAGVRSKAAARLASQAGFGGKVGEFPGSWLEWEKRGGAVQQE